MNLQERLNEMKIMKQKIIINNRSLWYFFFGVIIFTTFLLESKDFTLENNTIKSFAVVVSAIEIIILINIFLSHPTQYDNEIIRLETEIELEKIGVESDAKRSEKLFRAHQDELKRYYDQALRHSSLIMLVGICTLIIGFLIILSTLYLVYLDMTEGNSQTVIATLGGISGILVEFIAVIFLKMYSEIIKSTNDFHSRLVEINKLYYSNFISSKIFTNKTKEEAWAQIAVNLSNNKTN
ncbi:TRADD-N-associated membrane domain-containing protein [Paenibacillus wulumuqiensis]|uniref:TRADD-N-associated membrane domain-containing protein n=1 Tax=Paenibacillus wulumuqiensis TaxID=1567107 RepID=UPI000697153A|nr:hypothetical protein [Paenibacillus wulumuqiensis]